MKPKMLIHRIYQRIWSRDHLVRYIAYRLNHQIAAGMFIGTFYLPTVQWGNPGNKFVGTYEKELEPFFTSLHDDPPHIIFEIGASEGYYAIGFARLWPTSRVFAWEMDAKSREYFIKNAQLNNICERINLYTVCTEADLFHQISHYSPQLILMDVEGDEINLCSQRCIEAASKSNWVIECHNEEIIKKLHIAFQESHSIALIRNQLRHPKDIRCKLPWLLPNDRKRLVYEGRPFPTPWLLARPVR